MFINYIGIWLNLMTTFIFWQIYSRWQLF